jgi:hypothetical protein
MEVVQVILLLMELQEQLAQQELQVLLVQMALQALHRLPVSALLAAAQLL